MRATPSIHGQWLSHSSSLSAQDYTYDAAGRLTQVDDTVAGLCTRRQYAYDTDSNRLSLTNWTPVSSDCGAGTANAPLNSTYDAADRATKTNYAFDSFGRITTVPAADYDGTNNVTLGYYANDRVYTLQKGSGTTDTVSIDPTNRVRQLLSGSTTQTWHYSGESDSPAWIQESSGTNPPWTRNIAGPNGQLIATGDQGGTAVLQLTDLHGDVVASASTSGTATSLLTASDQTEFGGSRAASVARYSWLGGLERSADPATGALLMGARVYVPTLGRFTQVDPIVGGSANAYDYGAQDPVDHSDLTGTYWYTCAWYLTVHYVWYWHWQSYTFCMGMTKYFSWWETYDLAHPSVLEANDSVDYLEYAIDVANAVVSYWARWAVSHGRCLKDYGYWLGTYDCYVHPYAWRT